MIGRCSFPHGGPDQAAGVIVMVLSDSRDLPASVVDLDPERDRIVVVFNATPRWQSCRGGRGREPGLHPVQVAGGDPSSG